jgi:hypothetical protein
MEVTTTMGHAAAAAGAVADGSWWAAGPGRGHSQGEWGGW